MLRGIDGDGESFEDEGGKIGVQSQVEAYALAYQRQK